MRQPTLALLAILSAFVPFGCTGPVAEPDFKLDWDVDEELDPREPVCPPAQPDCDRLDEPDVDDTDDVTRAVDTDTAELGDGAGDTTTTEALADPVVNGKYRNWPNGRIPYKFVRNSLGNIALNATVRTRLSQAMTNWEVLTEGRVKFRAKTATDKAYVLIGVGSPRVSPFVGYRKDQIQNLYLRQTEPITVIKHELGHVIGLHHEQRRSDRLSYIQVRTANIVNTTTCKYQFSVCTNCAKVGTYDRSSVMHYRTSDLGNCRTGSVLLTPAGNAIAHYWQVSVKDRNAVAAMYKPPIPGLGGALTPQKNFSEADLPDSGRVMAAGRCMDVAGASTAEGAVITHADCHSEGNQDWRTTRTGQLRASHSLRCTAVAGNSVAGAAIEQAICSPTDERQQWRFEDMELVNGKFDSCLDVSGPRVTAAACSGNASQRLDYRPTLETITTAGSCLTAGDSGVSFSTCDGGLAQRWFQARGGFVSRANTGRCLGIAAAGVEIADCNDDVDQRWALRGAIRAASSELCLQGGARIALATCSASRDQTWTFWSR